MNEPLTADALLPHLKTAVLGRQTDAYQRIPSTQDAALNRGRSARSSPDGCLFTAESQTRGRGRQNNAWQSPPGVNLLFSVVLEPRARVARPALFTLAMANAVRSAASHAASLPLLLKWPNDVMLEEGKLCGVLTETYARGKKRGWVVGAGVNVNADLSDLPPGSASLKEAAGFEFNRAELLADILARLEETYSDLQRGEHERLLASTRRHSATLGQPVSAELNGRPFHGVAIDIDDEGALLARGETGAVRRIAAPF